MVEKKSILIDILLTVITGGLWNLWVQYRQIRDTNEALPEGQKKSFILLLLFSLLTFGLYFIWHEYKLTKELHILVYGSDRLEVELLCGVATFLGLWFIVDSYQQSLINEYCEKRPS
jgi:hypothetical protein